MDSRTFPEGILYMAFVDSGGLLVEPFWPTSLPGDLASQRSSQSFLLPSDKRVRTVLR